MRIALFLSLILTFFLISSPAARANESNHHKMNHGMITDGTMDVAVTPIRLPLVAYEPITLTFILSVDGASVTDDQLNLVHTQKLHILAIDPGLTDYHHLHPAPAQTPGTYMVDFLPNTNGPYKFYVQGTTKTDGVARTASFDLGGPFTSTANPDTSTKTIIDGTRLTLLTGDAPLRVGQMTHLTLQVTDLNDQPITTLEPLMGAFAHLVGFSDHGQHMAHMHPGGEEPKDDTARGGPQMMFMTTPGTAGKIALFAQIKLNGQIITAPFVVDVLPASD